VLVVIDSVRHNGHVLRDTTTHDNRIFTVTDLSFKTIYETYPHCQDKKESHAMVLQNC
jgi:hypothetical protein